MSILFPFLFTALISQDRIPELYEHAVRNYNRDTEYLAGNSNEFFEYTFGRLWRRRLFWTNVVENRSLADKKIIAATVLDAALSPWSYDLVALHTVVYGGRFEIENVIVRGEEALRDRSYIDSRMDYLTPMLKKLRLSAPYPYVDILRRTADATHSLNIARILHGARVKSTGDPRYFPLTGVLRACLSK